ncbi:MAG TPA: alcohol dehydrogenase catalytic domain-containing protein, partial [Thermoplasmata archaeon]|nr:alcohol dehydrogenase catalytic domain-containing protein [Thermoplasmata archaeon]
MAKELYDIGEIPSVGEVPKRMHAQLVRPDRFGEPEKSIQDEVIDVPPIGPGEALIMVMAAGVNFNNVWAARGVPIDVTKTQARWGEPTDFHIVGSDASGVVTAVGDGVANLAVGDRVVVHAGQWDSDDPWVLAGKDPGLAASFRVWGYDT